MRVVGIDTHKATLAACLIDEVGLVVAEATFPNDPAGFAALLAWLREAGGVERIRPRGLSGVRCRGGPRRADVADDLCSKRRS
jgi:Transposase